MVTIGKLISTGMGAARMTEASVRRILSDTKDNISGVLASEIKRFLAQVDIQRELTKALTNIQLEINATIRIAPQDGHPHKSIQITRHFPRAKRGK